MDHPALVKLTSLAREPDALEATVQYLAEKLSFLKRQENVLICFASHEAASIGGLIERAVQRCGAVPIRWEKDFRWKTLLRLAFSSRASTIIGPPLTVLGLSKLAKANGTPLYIRNVVTAGYPCLDWMIDGIVKGLDCNTWGCFEPGHSSIVSGFSCGCSRGVHLRDDVYGADIVDDDGNPLPEGEVGEVVLYFKKDPSIRYPTGDRARLDNSACNCGYRSPRLMDISVGRDMETDLSVLGQYLHNWSSILDCRLKKGPYGLEMEIVTFPGEQLPKLPTAAKQIIRPWDPENDKPFWYTPRLKKH